MSRKKKEIMWFGCKNCMIEPKRDESQSNENWSVYKNEPCPTCGGEMRIHFEPPPVDILEKR